MSALPKGWATSTIGEWCVNLDSKRIPINSDERKERLNGKKDHELFPYYGATGQVGRIDGYLFDGEYVLIGEDGAPFMDPYKDKAYMVSGRFWVNNHAHILEPYANPKFTCYYLNQFRYADHVTGTTRLKLTKAALEQMPIVIPPLAEQERIVGKVEELFSELAEGVANLKQARAQLAVYRQALLKHAFEGHLTAIKGIKKVPLSSLITDLSQGWSPKCELNRAPKPDEWAVIKTTAIQHCRYDDTEAKPLPPPFEGRPSIEIKDGDFLMTRKGPRTRAGVSCYVRRTRHRLMVCDTVYRFRCIEDVVNPLYLELALNSPEVLRAIDQRKAGISESGLSLTHSKIGTVEIPLCSLDEQEDVVRQLDEQTSVMDALEADIDLNLQKAEALRQSILKKAFAGELVPQDPADEPAAALLARIRAEREAQTTKTTKRNTRR